MNIKEHVSISEKNSKLGKIPNISLPPFITCIDNAPCAEECYAGRFYKRWSNVRDAYNLNLKTYKSDPELYFRCIDTYLLENGPEYFRWHVSGDVPDLYYLIKILTMAIAHPNTKFLVFTKKYKYLENFNINQFMKYVENLSIIMSAWVGLPLPKYELIEKYTIAFTEDDDRKYNYIECEGTCHDCGKCWELRNSSLNVCLKKI